MVPQLTEGLNAKAASHPSEAKFFALAESFPALVVVRQGGRCCYANAAFVTLCGCSRAEVLSRPLWDWIHADYREVIRERALHREAGESVPSRYEFPFVTATGQTRWIDCTAIAIEFEGAPTVLGVGFDVTERRGMEQNLKASEERFRHVVEHIREVFWMTDLEKTKIIYVSPAYEEIWGRSRASLYASPLDWAEAVHPEDRDRVLRAELSEQSKTHFHEIYRIVRPDGSIRWIEDRAFPVRDESGEICRITGIAEDITERKRAEQRSAIFSQLGHRLSATATPAEAARIIFDAAEELVSWDAGYLHLISEDRLIVPVLTIDTIDGKKTDVPINSFNLDPSPLMLQVMEKGGLRVDRATGQDSAAPALLVPFGDKTRLSASMLYVPIQHAGEALGILSIQSYTSGAFTEADLTALQELANHTAASLSRIHSAAALAESEMNNRALLEALPDWVFRFRRDGTLLDSKAPKQFLLPAAQKRARGRDLKDLLPKSVLRRFLGAMEEAIKTGAAQSIEFEQILHQQLYHFEARLVVAGADLFLAMVRDVTERKRLEKEVLEISAGERRRIGNDLHDGVSQQLGAGAFKAKLLQNELAPLSPPHAQRAGEILNLIQATMRNLRSVVRGLDPLDIKSCGLVGALSKLAQDTGNFSGVDCVFASDCSKLEVDGETGRHLYRLAQEAIHNASKHSAAQRIEVTLRLGADQFSLSVRDNGKGFVADTEPFHGIGLRTMRYRAHLIGGTLQVSSGPGRGTEILCVVPLSLRRGGGRSTPAGGQSGP